MSIQRWIKQQGERIESNLQRCFELYGFHAPILPRFVRIQECMQRVSLDSSSIASIGYAPEQQVLEVEFRQSGEVYQYFDVPAEEHAGFLAAASKGTYLNLHFKP